MDGQGAEAVIDRAERLEVGSRTTGREFVAAFGEPRRKGGGDGWVGPYLEWGSVEILATKKDGDGNEAEGTSELGSHLDETRTVSLGIMVELRDPGAGEVLTPEQLRKGAGGVWDRAGGWTWACLKLFEPEPKTGR